MLHETYTLPLLPGQTQAAVLKSYCFEAPGENNKRWELPQRLPAIIVCPGGSYVGGSAKMKEPVALKFMMQGYQAFTLDYGYGAESEYPLPQLNLARALMHLREQAAHYRLDPDRIAVLGFSAGGHLASLYTSTYRDAPWRKQINAQDEELAVQAVLAGYPVLHLSDFIQSFDVEDLHKRYGKMFQRDLAERDPYRMLNKDSAAHFIFACREDNIVKASATLAFVEKALELGVKVEFHLFSEGGHGISTADALSMQGQNYPKRTALWLPLAVNWLNDHFAYHFYDLR